MSAEERREIKMDVETLPGKKVDVSLEDNSKVSLRDIYMRLCACRDFEIKLQWERAVFLTAFLIACFAGYGSFLLSVHQRGYGDLPHILVKGIPLAISLVGIILSLLWVLMAKGSKAWYEHYEQAIEAFAKQNSHVDEWLMSHRWIEIDGIMNAGMSNLITNQKGGAYSVSKIVILIGQLSLIVWWVLFLLHAAIASFGMGNVINVMRGISNSLVLWKFIGIIFVAVILMICVSYWAKSRYLECVRRLIFGPPSITMTKKKSFWAIHCYITEAQRYIKSAPPTHSSGYLLVGKNKIICFDSNGIEVPAHVAMGKVSKGDWTVIAKMDSFWPCRWRLYAFDV